MADVTLELLTDEAIVDYAKSDGKERIIQNHKDLNLRGKRPVQIQGGLYDTEIFGSPMPDRCVCGKITRPMPEPCPHCGARVFTREESMRRFARIDLPFYYLNDLRFGIFKELFDTIFSGTEIKLDFLDNDLRKGGYSLRGKSKLEIKVFDTCQFIYNKAKNTLTVTEFITDLNKCSYEGLYSIIEEHFPNYLVNYRKLINKYYLVQPAALRPYTLAVIKGKKKLGMHKLSTWYSSIVRFCCAENIDGNNENYLEVMNNLETPGEKARYNALLRAFINSGKKEATDLLNSSKQNLARNLYSIRTKNSARCPIVPDTEGAIDEISVPIHLAYEMCRDGFIDYLMLELNFTRKEALKATREEYDNPETQRLFKEYAEKQVVLNIKRLTKLLLVR